MGENQLDTLQNLILERYGFLIHYDEGRPCPYHRGWKYDSGNAGRI